MQQTVIAVFSLSLALLGLSYLLQARAWARVYVEFESHPQRLVPTGFLMIAAGLFVALVVNDWSSTWPIFITAFGWLLAAKGAILAAHPGLLTPFARVLSGEGLVRYIRLGGLLVFGLGSLLVWEYLLQARLV